MTTPATPPPAPGQGGAKEAAKAGLICEPFDVTGIALSWLRIQGACEGVRRPSTLYEADWKDAPESQWTKCEKIPGGFRATKPFVRLRSDDHQQFKTEKP